MVFIIDIALTVFILAAVGFLGVVGMALVRELRNDNKKDNQSQD